MDPEYEECLQYKYKQRINAINSLYKETLEKLNEEREDLIQLAKDEYNLNLHIKKIMPNEYTDFFKCISDNNFKQANDLLCKLEYKNPFIIYAIEDIINKSQKISQDQYLLVKNIITIFSKLSCEQKYVYSYLNSVVNSCFIESNTIMVELLKYTFLSEKMLEYVMQKIIISGPMYLLFFINQLKNIYTDIDYKMLVKRVIIHDSKIWNTNLKSYIDLMNYFEIDENDIIL